MCPRQRCAPPDNRPTREELDNCRPYLEAELRMLGRIEVIVTAGADRPRVVAESLGLVGAPRAPRSPRLLPTGPSHGCRTTQMLLCSYHPSRQNTQTGRLTRPMWSAVFRRARELVSR